MVDGLRDKYANSLALAILLAAACSISPAWARLLPSASARTTPPEPQRVAGLPSDAELERSGARIGYIHLDERPLFDVENHDENTALSRTANRLHIATREATIMDQLLFRSGDPYRAS